ncbi:peptidoglycan-binding protein [Xanthomonas citri pv. glycines]|uniref:Peptidase M23 n=1 Tax=Xanthomonas campestris pv. glycines TaxID=473421 RepID=A0AAX0HUL3_XANCG|nr:MULTISPECIES: peptidoglycan-binding protein [Xanthomonas]AOY64587.1 peptidase M23 [Xanthomonas citri pv. glycines str. 8ra]ARV21518.1 peptidase M23 [Xanthomonas citri pv. glycines str. 12-2]OEY88229.1 peptidase M23 [Xanthomonas citri pv. glycines]OOX02384.1 peptidase M23 [Xanthomonas citri pv. glycines]QDR43740.1 peptidoglycan DD-metalloendopeptidase family protein [Xanthomonas citri pv. glycines]
MATDRETGLLQAAYAAGITRPNELANFMAQVGHESGGLNRLEEGFRYTRGSSQVSSKVRSALREGPEALEEARLEALRGQPEKLAELMYGGRMGNNEPGDGYLYRGRGYIQLTGKDQYREAGEALKLDLVAHPELAAQPENASRIATWYWQHNVPQAARQDAHAAGVAINGGDPPNGLADRESRFARWQRDLTPDVMHKLEHGQLGQTVAPAQHSAPAQTPHAGSNAHSFQATMERMLPPQSGTAPHVTGHYGEQRSARDHGGTDFNYQGGQTGRNLQHPTVHSPVAGTVTFAGGSYGTVKIRDAQGNSHEILHLDGVKVKEGQTLSAGDAIGTMGGRGPNSASQYAQHVHYQLRDANGKLTSPENFWNQGHQHQAGARHTQAASASGTGAVRHGDSSQDVGKLQQDLNRLGVRDAQGNRLAEDGRFGDNTREAVMAFQKQHGLQQDGVVGRDTRAALSAQQVQTREAQVAAPKGPSLNDASHPDHALHNAIRSKLPSMISNETAAHVTLQAKQNGIDSADKLQNVTVQDGKAFVMGTTPGFRAAVDLNQPAPTLEQTSAQLLAGQSQQQQAQQEQQKVAMGGR